MDEQERFRQERRLRIDSDELIKQGKWKGWQYQLGTQEVCDCCGSDLVHECPCTEEDLQAWETWKENNI